MNKKLYKCDVCLKEKILNEFQNPARKKKGKHHFQSCKVCFEKTDK